MGATIHGSCVVLARAGEPFGAPRDAGMLLIGPSGSGKSDLALRLIAVGAVLVADDRVELFVQHGTLRARAPQALAGLVEIRGVGIVEMEYARLAQITLACLLTQDPLPRLPEPAWYEPPADAGIPAGWTPVPLQWLNPFEASAPEKVAAAAAAHARSGFHNTSQIS